MLDERFRVRQKERASWYFHSQRRLSQAKIQPQ
jgi:hypothetical protein